MFRKMRSIISMPLYDKWGLAQLWFYRVKGMIFYRCVFASFGKGSSIYPPTLIGGPSFIHIGANVIIRSGVRLQAIVLDPANPPEIRIGNNVNIEQDVHILAIGKIHIGDNVSLTARSAVLGGSHPFLNVRDPAKIGDRVDGVDSVTEIGEGCFVGIGSIISMNVKMGRQVVVGSNSVVRGVVPDRCVVEGQPAVVVLQYDSENDRWTRTRKE